MNHVELIGVVASQVRLEGFPAAANGPQTKETLLCAVRRRPKDQAPDWERVETWGAQARNLVRFNGKGPRVAITGRLRGTFYSPDGKERGGQLRLTVVAGAVTYLSAPTAQEVAEPRARGK